MNKQSTRHRAVIKVIYLIIGIQFLFFGLPYDVYAGLCSQSNLRTPSQFQKGTLAEKLQGNYDGGYKGKVAILGGTGDIGKGFTARLGLGEVDVIIGTRDPAKKIKDKEGNVLDITTRQDMEKWAEEQGISSGRISVETNNAAVKDAELVVLAVNWQFALSTVEDVFEDLKNDAIIICPAVSLDMSQGPKNADVSLPEGYNSAAEMVQDMVNRLNKEKGKQVKVVSVLQNIHFKILQDHACPLCNDVIIIGDDQAAKEKVADMVRQMSKLEPVILGGIEDSIHVERVTPLDIRMGQQTIAMANAEAGFGLMDLVLAMKEKGRILTRDEVMEIEKEKVDIASLRIKIKATQALPERSSTLDKFLKHWNDFLAVAEEDGAASARADGGKLKNRVLGQRIEKGDNFKEKKVPLEKLVTRARGGDRRAQAELDKIKDLNIRREIKRLQNQKKDGGTAVAQLETLERLIKYKSDMESVKQNSPDLTVGLSADKGGYADLIAKDARSVAFSGTFGKMEPVSLNQVNDDVFYLSAVNEEGNAEIFTGVEIKAGFSDNLVLADKGFRDLFRLHEMLRNNILVEQYAKRTVDQLDSYLRHVDDLEDFRLIALGLAKKAIGDRQALRKLFEVRGLFYDNPVKEEIVIEALAYLADNTLGNPGTAQKKTGSRDGGGEQHSLLTAEIEDLLRERDELYEQFVSLDETDDQRAMTREKLESIAERIQVLAQGPAGSAKEDSRDGGKIPVEALQGRFLTLKNKFALQENDFVQIEAGKHYRFTDAEYLIVVLAPDTVTENQVYILKEKGRYYVVSSDGRDIRRLRMSLDIGRNYPAGFAFAADNVLVGVNNLNDQFLFVKNRPVDYGVLCVVPKNTDARVWINSIGNFVELPGKDGGNVQEKLINTAVHSEDIEDVLSAVRELAEFKNPRVRKVLVDLAKDHSDFRVRQAARESLNEVANRNVIRGDSPRFNGDPGIEKEDNSRLYASVEGGASIRTFDRAIKEGLIAGEKFINALNESITAEKEAFQKFGGKEYEDFAESLKWLNLNRQVEGALVVEAGVILNNPGTIASLEELRKDSIDLTVAVYAASAQQLQTLKALGIDNVADIVEETTVKEMLRRLVEEKNIFWERISVVKSLLDATRDVSDGYLNRMMEEHAGFDVVVARTPDQGKVNNMPLVIARAVAHVYKDQRKVAAKFKELTRTAVASEYISEEEKMLLDTLGFVNVPMVKATDEIVAAQERYQTANQQIANMI